MTSPRPADTPLLIKGEGKGVRYKSVLHSTKNYYIYITNYQLPITNYQLPMKKVAIVGGGPTGVTLALMLVQRGIAVTLVEAASDFNRVFRGEALMPSGLNAFDEMGLSTILEQIPHRKLNAWKFILDKKPLFKVDEPIETNTQSCTLFSQPPLL
ncbi:MAG: FAD-dependent oxidoreductase, partial [Cyanobacteria bacterium J06621_15]